MMRRKDEGKREGRKWKKGGGNVGDFEICL